MRDPKFYLPTGKIIGIIYQVEVIKLFLRGVWEVPRHGGYIRPFLRRIVPLLEFHDMGEIPVVPSAHPRINRSRGNILVLAENEVVCEPWTPDYLLQYEVYIPIFVSAIQRPG